MPRDSKKNESRPGGNATWHGSTGEKIQLKGSRADGATIDRGRRCSGEPPRSNKVHAGRGRIAFRKRDPRAHAWPFIKHVYNKHDPRVHRACVCATSRRLWWGGLRIDPSALSALAVSGGESFICTGWSSFLAECQTGPGRMAFLTTLRVPVHHPPPVQSSHPVPYDYSDVLCL